MRLGIMPAPRGLRADLAELGVSTVRVPAEVREDMTADEISTAIENICREWTGFHIILTVCLRQFPTHLERYLNGLRVGLQAAAGRIGVLQLENEVQGGFRYWRGTQPEYRRLLRRAVPVIREADPNITIAAAGICSTAAVGHGWQAQRLLVLARELEIAADVHIYHRAEDVAPTLAWARSVYGDGTLLVTETGGPDGRSVPYSDARNAEEVHLRAAACREAGVDTMCWWRLRAVARSRWDAMALERRDGTRKASWFAMQEECRA